MANRPNNGYRRIQQPKPFLYRAVFENTDTGEKWVEGPYVTLKAVRSVIGLRKTRMTDPQTDHCPIKADIEVTRTNWGPI